ncbi:MAG: hypothetical protein PXZ08_00925 [Actinomycetota bacterium]|nr:hypothetical protein [Actinomycetota bacterium]
MLATAMALARRVSPTVWRAGGIAGFSSTVSPNVEPPAANVSTAREFCPNGLGGV